ncbi:hypothetical protein [Streptomyces mirabilis]|uniref:hypothetical protein n=1 Tax=Streptomyces mirabilis TaxID=68239 RepID=UPI0032497460
MANVIAAMSTAKDIHSTGAATMNRSPSKTERSPPVRAPDIVLVTPLDYELYLPLAVTASRPRTVFAPVDATSGLAATPAVHTRAATGGGRGADTAVDCRLAAQGATPHPDRPRHRPA